MNRNAKESSQINKLLEKFKVTHFELIPQANKTTFEINGKKVIVQEKVVPDREFIVNKKIMKIDEMLIYLYERLPEREKDLVEEEIQFCLLCPKEARKEFYAYLKSETDKRLFQDFGDVIKLTELSRITAGKNELNFNARFQLDENQFEENLTIKKYPLRIKRDTQDSARNKTRMVTLWVKGVRKKGKFMEDIMHINLYYDQFDKMLLQLINNELQTNKEYNFKKRFSSEQYFL